MIDFELYLAGGLLLHFGLFYLVHYFKFLRWPDGMVLAAFLSFMAYLANFTFWLILISFFIPSSILSNVNKDRKRNLIISGKSSQRRGSQVVANSAGFMLFSLIQLIENGVNGEINVLLYLSASIYLISASSDTWSTEIGTLSKSEPRSILNLKKTIPKGTSGGVTLLGTAGGFLGSAYLSLISISFIFMAIPNSQLALFTFILVFYGFGGQVVDSVLGATLQNKYYCTQCSVQVEHEYHASCKSEKLEKVSWYTFLDNNTVNFTANSLITIIGFLSFLFII